MTLYPAGMHCPAWTMLLIYSFRIWSVRLSNHKKCRKQQSIK